VTLSDVRIRFAGGGTSAQAAAEVPEHPAQYPESTMFGALPAYGFYCRHVAGLTFRNVQVGWAEPDHRPAVVCDDVTDLNIDGFRAQSTLEAPAQIVLRNVRDAILRGCFVPSGVAAFLRVEAGTSGVSLFDSDLSRAAAPFVMGKDVPPAAVYHSGNRLPRSRGEK
jgi:hypothetical protein